MPIFPTSGASIWRARGWSLERDPLPDAEAWRAIEDRRERLRVGLRAIYDWYERNADLAACVLRDAEYHALTREIVGAAVRTAAWRPIARCSARKLGAKQRAVLRLALSFFTWRTLVRESGLKQGAAVGAMVQAIDGAG